MIPGSFFPSFPFWKLPGRINARGRAFRPAPSGARNGWSRKLHAHQLLDEELDLVPSRCDLRFDRSRESAFPGSGDPISD